jgi:hypothetical protein
VYIPVVSSKPTMEAADMFNSLMLDKPNPWRPSPVIHSLALSSSLSVRIAADSLFDWLTLAAKAERNIPFLEIGPTAAGHKDTDTDERYDSMGPQKWLKYTEDMKLMAKKNNVDWLGVWNLTVQAREQEVGFGMNVAVVEAMMVINWLSRLKTS